jgi:hypothetical protein
MKDIVAGIGVLSIENEILRQSAPKPLKSLKQCFAIRLATNLKALFIGHKHLNIIAFLQL